MSPDPGDPGSQRYAPLTVKAAWQLSAPQSWVASVGPVLVGGLAAFVLSQWRFILLTRVSLFSVSLGGLYIPALSVRSALVWLLMLICAVAAQSAVNTLNDYKDFVAGTDTEQNCVDTTDASIIYNHLAPKTARNFGIACLALALVAGVAVALLSTPWLLLIGAAGIIALLSYSYGPAPVSYLPLGEVVSGVTFGLLITVGTFVALAGVWSWWLLLPCVQQIISIGLIMMTNNTCDIERDIEAGRRTLPTLLGRRRSLIWLAAGNVLAIISLGVFSLLLGLAYCLPVIVACIFASGLLQRFVKLRFDAQDRPRAMGISTKLARVLAAANCAVLLLFVLWH